MVFLTERHHWNSQPKAKKHCFHFQIFDHEDTGKPEIAVSGYSRA